MADSLIGRVIATKFAIESPIGTGAMGAVYRARHVALDKAVAVKVLHQALAKDPTFAARMQVEAKAASRLDHPNSVRVIDFGEEPDGLLYIAMELLDGVDLLHIIDEDWPLPDVRIVDLLCQALGALAQAHEMGIVHRDLKPENIMVMSRIDDEGRPRDIVKVCDFGIAKIGGPGETDAPRKGGRALTTSGTIIGTPEYMSPEQCRGESLDARSDIYSAGIILYQLLTGRVPFQSDHALDVVLKHISEEPAPPSRLRPGVSPNLERVCMRALRKQRTERPASARGMRAELREAIEQGSVPNVVSSRRVRAALAETLPVGPPTSPRVPPPPSTRDETRLTTTSTGLREVRATTRRPLRYWAAGTVTVVAAIAATAAVRIRAAPPPAVPAPLAASVVFAPPPVETQSPAPQPSPAPTPSATPSTPATVDKVTARHRSRWSPQPSPVGAAAEPPLPVPAEVAPPPPAAQPIASPMIAAPIVEPSPPAAERSPAVSAPAPRFDPTKGRVTWTVSGAGGGATAGNVTHALARASSAWQHCYEVGLAARSARLEGTATMKLTCDDEGRVIGASFTGLGAPDVAACVQAAPRGITIPNADTGDAWATITLTFKVLD